MLDKLVTAFYAPRLYSEHQTHNYLALFDAQSYTDPREIGGEPLLAVVPQQAIRLAGANIALVENPRIFDDGALTHAGQTRYLRILRSGLHEMRTSNSGKPYLVPLLNCYPLTPQLEKLLP